VGGIFCDLETMFDCVDHDILLSEFNFYAINGKDNALYQFYLDNRYVSTATYTDSDYSHKVSTWAKARQGVRLGTYIFSSTYK
jgi:hypothetical protein